MSFRVVVKIPPGLELASQRLQDGVEHGIARATGLVTNTAIAKAPRRTGNLKRSIQAVPVTGGGGTFLGRTIQNPLVAKYGKWVEDGTGIYGPKGEPIRPTSKPFLVWKNKGQWYRKRSVKGMRPRPYMKPALKDNIDAIEKILQEEVNKALRG